MVGEDVAWSESNAVIYANSVLGARTVKHPDFLDLCMALTGRAAQSGVYLEAGRRARRIVKVAMPEGADDAFWPLLGWVLGNVAPDRIPRVVGLRIHTLAKMICARCAQPLAPPLRRLCYMWRGSRPRRIWNQRRRLMKLQLGRMTLGTLGRS